MNKLFAILLLAIGILPLFLVHEATVFLFVAVPAVVIFFSKHDYVSLKYGDPRRENNGR